MGAIDNIADACNARFRAQVELGVPVPTTYDNFPDQHPDDAVWVRFEVQFGENIFAEIRTDLESRYRRNGAIVATIHAPVRTGWDASNRLADHVETQFRTFSLSGVRFQAPSTERLGRSRDDKWWLTRVRCPFLVDEIALHST